MTRYAAFISYSNRQREWALVLQRNLEASLGHRVFLDTVDVGAGRSWIAGR